MAVKSRSARNLLRPKALCRVSRSVREWPARRQRLLGTTLSAREGRSLKRLKEALLTSFEVVAYGALLLLLPCVVADRIFDLMLAETLAQIMLVGVAGTAILTTIAVYEGWYLEQPSDWGLAHDRIERDLSAESRREADTQRSGPRQ